jgi:hypothetical protein
MAGQDAQYPQLAEVREYAAAGAAVDAAADDPGTGGGKACYLRIVTAAAPNDSLEVTYANGNTRAITVVTGDVLRFDFTGITANTTCGPVQVGWE